MPQILCRPPITLQSFYAVEYTVMIGILYSAKKVRFLQQE